MRTISLLYIVVITSCGFFAEEDEAQMPELPEPPRISRSITYPVERTDIIEAVEGIARATPTQMQSLYFRVGGRIQSIAVGPEQWVEAGQTLAKLEIDDLEHQIAIALIDREIAAATLGKLLAATTPLVEIKIQELIVDKHDINVEYLRRRVNSAYIRAPFDGVIERVQATVSELVSEYEPVIELSDPTELELQMAVSQSEYHEIGRTMEAEVQLDNGEWASARIVQLTHVNPRIDAAVNREQFIVHLEIALSRVDLSIYQRMPSRIIITRRENTLVIPSSGLRSFNGRKYVRVLEGDMRREVDVKVGIHTETKVEILEGLKEGDLVIGK